MSIDKMKEHWPVITLIFVITLVLLLTLVRYQIEENEYAVIKRFGKVVDTAKPGPGWQLPFVTDVWRHDNRIHVFSGNKGEMEEVFTKDRRNIVVSVFLTWKIDEEGIVLFMNNVGTEELAEEKLTALLSDVRGATFGQYVFKDLINTSKDALKLSQIEADMLKPIKANAKAIGIDVQKIGIAHLGFPITVTQKVFERMNAEREAESKDIISQGEAKAQEIIADANRVRDQKLSNARKEAEAIKAEGDTDAAESYDVFKKNPSLAIFLMRLQLAEEAFKKRDTVIMDTRTPPFNLFTEEYLNQLEKKKK
ncbi:MAG: protease modulator HflC [Lentisphaeria bacterium]|nr:protease modulator HflC [Lentisphaeria bacterium]NQZ71087.1 protease modulator HflC [Lentisphaeria bacterium]